MNQQMIPFRVERLEACAPDGVPVEWQGKTFNSGPLTITLDEHSGNASKGVLDYSQNRATAEFHVHFEFPEFARLLETFGVSAELTQPVRAVLVSKGNILEDHSFVLSGACTIQEHGLFPSSETSASVLPGQ